MNRLKLLLAIAGASRRATNFSATGVTCTVPNGTGFEISRSGITPVS